MPFKYEAMSTPFSDNPICENMRFSGTFLSDDGNEVICLNKANHDSYFATHMDRNKLNGVKSCLIMGHDIMGNIRR